MGKRKVKIVSVENLTNKRLQLKVKQRKDGMMLTPFTYWQVIVMAQELIINLTMFF